MECIVCLVVGYAFGSILAAEIVARVMVHKFAFDLGDGIPGMANIGHALGTKRCGERGDTVLDVLL